MEYKNILLERDEDTLKVTLNRPEVLNAISNPMIMELMDLFSKLRDDDEIRFLVFTGAGRAFSSGADLKEMGKAFEEGLPQFMEDGKKKQKLGHRLMKEVENLEQITIAAVNGVMAGAGMALALACDFRIASDKATFSIPETNVGVFFTWGCTPRLIKLVGPSKAKELIVTCDTIDASEALRIGLVNKVVPHERLMDEVKDFIQKIRRTSSIAVKFVKLIANAYSTPIIGDLTYYEPELVRLCYMSEDYEEAVRAFGEKRKPKFTGKLRIKE